MEFAKFLQKTGCKKVQIMTCDVCENCFFPANQFQLLVKFVRKYKRDWQAINKALREAAPPEAFTRVHAQTSLGYLTFCFYCDNTMCCNEVQYQEDPNWDRDESHKKTAYEVLKKLQKLRGLKITKFLLYGSTKWRICIQAVIAKGEQEFIEMKTSKIIQIEVIPENEFIIRSNIVKKIGNLDLQKIFQSF